MRLMEGRVSFTAVLTALTLILSLVPAVVIWVVFMDLMTTSVNLLKATTQDSTNSMAQGIQTLLITQAVDKLTTRLTEGANELLVQAAMIQASGLLASDLRPSRFDVAGRFLIPYRDRNFVTMKGHAFFSNMGMTGALWSNHSSPTTTRMFWLQWSALYIDVLTGVTGNRTLYLNQLQMHPDEQVATLTTYYADQTMGALLATLQTTTAPAANFDGTYARSGWDTNLGFNAYSGQVEISGWQWFPAQNDTWMQAGISVSAQTISDELHNQLDGSPNDRLVIFFRQPHGHMIAASHGKFFSDSDVDLRYVNVILHPPNISSYRLWNCLQSNDVFIPLACQQLHATYQSWPAIPVLQTEMLLAGQQYWVATGYVPTGLNATVLMLKNRAAVMGSIDSSNVRVDDQVASKKGVTFVVLGVVSAMAVVLPLGVGVWLGARLMRLAAGMDMIAKLQFNVKHAPPTLFSELHRFQSSFMKMERGLQAFGKFVPQAVVKVLIAGDMKSNERMVNETLTIMFADIEGFSTVCETVPPEVLMAVCTEYFEATCKNIVQAHGTLDKFIGDCIMALWNAPERLPGHERDAVSAVLAMQDSVMQLHSSWQQRGLPILKFRAGIHTGACLVGNFGCSYRVSYTCLGDGVNLAARLEALNKKFGTYLCVSHATYQSCCDDFCFRRLAKVTVPGKAEVLPVYEVLCRWVDGDLPHSPASIPVELPGSVSLDDTLKLISHEDNLLLASHVRLQSGPEGSSSGPGTLRRLGSDGPVPYHWQRVPRQALLEQSARYEAAYAAMVRGDLTAAKALLADGDCLAIPDKAWRTLLDQLNHLDPAQPWDGVFYFTEK
eukprot:EG_transcript_3139